MAHDPGSRQCSQKTEKGQTLSSALRFQESVIIAVTVAVPIIVVVPVTVGAPFLAIRVIPGLIVRPAFLERLFQFPPGFICLGTVLAALAKFMPIMLLRLLDAAAAFRA